MLKSYLDLGMRGTAVFEFFVRKIPHNRGFMLAAGLEQVLDYLENLRLTNDEVTWLAESQRFPNSFIDELAHMRFTGDVHAMPEGTVFFPDEPILRVTAPLPQAQWIESRLINILHYQSLVATKAARCVLAAPGKLLVDFGLRRAHGAEAGMFAARASYLAGFTGTSNVLAAPEYGIPIFGTMAHSYIQAHATELEAFEHFAQSDPNNTILLIDTYDTEAAAEKCVALARRLKEQGIYIKGVRLDSGDLYEHSRKVRAILDAGGLHDVTIFSSGGIDEFVMHDLLARGAPIDGFGVGTHLVTSNDAPYFDCAYKLQEYAGVARRKRSEGKATWPGRKQVYRRYDVKGTMIGDVLTLESDHQPGDGLTLPYMRAGKRIAPPDSLASIRERAKSNLNALPPTLQTLEAAPPYPVKVAPPLRALADEIDRRAK